MKKFKILNFIPSLSGGGAELQLCYLAPELARRGHEVHIAYSSPGPEQPELPGVSLYQVKKSSNYDPYLFWQLIRLIRRIKPDVIQTWIMQMDILGGMAAKLNGVPWIFREPSSAQAYPMNWKFRLRERIGSWADFVISNSRGGDEYWKAFLPDERRCLISNGLPLREIEKTTAALPAGLEEPQMPIVLYVGRLSSDVTGEKNLRNFLEVIAEVKKKQDIMGVICGEGPQRKELEALGQKLGLQEHLYFTGHLPAVCVWALMKKASLLVSLSAFEGCPNVVMEAIACHCPLLLSDIPAHRELLGDDPALFVDPQNIHGTADTMIRALREIDEAKARALRAGQKTQEWSIASAAKNWERVYQKCV